MNVEIYGTLHWWAQTPDCSFKSLSAHDSEEQTVKMFSVYIHLVTCLLTVVDLLEEDSARGKEVAQFGQIDPVPEPLLQLCGGWQLFVQTGLHPPVKKCTGNSHYTGHSEGTLLIVLLIIHDADDKIMFVL